MNVLKVIFIVGAFFFYANLYGQCLQGECVNGRGVYRFENGDIYIGDFKERVPNGLGIMSYSGKATREGEWRNGGYVGFVKNKVDSSLIKNMRSLYIDYTPNREGLEVKSEGSFNVDWSLIVILITTFGVLFGIVDNFLNIREKIKRWDE